jgi:hypothetical protein
MLDHAIAHVEGVVTDPSMRFMRRPEAARYLKDSMASALVERWRRAS